MKDESVSPPAIESIMVVYSIKEESKRSCVSKKFVARGCIAVKKSVEVEAKPGEPLSPAKNNMTEGIYLNHQLICCPGRKLPLSPQTPPILNKPNLDSTINSNTFPQNM